MMGGQRHNPKKLHKFCGLFKASIATTTQKYRRLFSAPPKTKAIVQGQTCGLNFPHWFLKTKKQLNLAGQQATLRGTNGRFWLA